MVLQVRADDQAAVLACLDSYGLGDCSRVIGRVEQDHNDIQIIADGREQFRAARIDLHRAWSEVSWKMQRLRDNPDCADAEYERILDITDPGLHAELSFDLGENPAVKAILAGSRPQVAILREQGVNGQLEMAAAFDRAGFSAVDVTMRSRFFISLGCGICLNFFSSIRSDSRWVCVTVVRCWQHLRN